MAVQINVAANQAALTASIQAGVQAYNQKFAANNQINLSINQRAFSQPLGRITGDVKDFEAALAASNARVIAFGASTAVLGGVIRSFKELANVTIEVEKDLADLNRVFGLTTSQLQKFSTQLFDVSKQTASTFDQASKAALEFSRQGLKAEDTLQRTKDALTLTRLAGISTANAVDALTSTVNGFAATGVTTTQILNKLVAVEQDYAVGAGDLAEALSRTGQAAQEAGVSLDQLNALVTSAQQSTARGGAVIGNALKTIFTRLQRTETLDQLEAFNIAVRDVQGNILPAVTILQNFAGAYKGLADAQRAQLSEQVAGVYQVNILKAIVNDLNKSQGVYVGALQRGASATNEAEIATARLNKTLDALLSQTATSAQQLANNIGKVTFEPLARYGTEQLKSLVENMNEILEGEGIGSTFANGLLKGIRNILAGPGAIAAFFTLFKLIQNSFTYLSQALPQIAGITTETQNRKNIEQSILQIMQQQGPISQALAGTMGNQAAQAALLLQLARQQTAEYQQQTSLARQLASQLSNQGVKVKSGGGLQVTRSGGYVPTASKLAEVVGAKSGGYKPGKVVPSPVGGVMNTAEDVKYIPGFAQPFINPPANSKAGRAHRQNSINRTGVDPYVANGFIPNFAATKLFIDDKGEAITGKKPNKTKDSYTLRLTDYNPRNLKADEDLDLKRKLVDSGYWNDSVRDPKTGKILHYHGEPNNIYDKLSGNLKVVKYLNKDEVDKATKIAWDGLISGNTAWMNDPNITKLGMDQSSVEAAFNRTKAKLGLKLEDFQFKKQASEDSSVAASNEKYRSLKTKIVYKTPQEFEKSLNGDFNNFIGDFYEQLVLKNKNVSGAYQISAGNTDPADLVPKILGSTMYKGIEAKNTAARINDLIAKAIRINVAQMNQETWDKSNDVDFGTLPIYQTKGVTISHNGFIPNFSPLIDDNARNKHDFPGGVPILPIPDKALQNIVDRQKKRQMTYLDFDRTLVRTMGDIAYSRVSPDQKKGVLQKMFLNKEARLNDIKSSKLTQFGELLRKKIQEGVINPSLLGLLTASDETPGMPEYISSIWGIPKRNQVYSAKPGTKEARLAALGVSADGFIPNFAPPISMLRIPWFRKYADPSFDAKQPTLKIAGATSTDTFRTPQFRSKSKEYYQKNGDGNIFGPMYEKFVRSAISLQANKSKIKSIILGQSLEPDTIEGESSFDAFMELANTNPLDILDLVGIEIKAGPKDAQTGGSATGIITKKYNNFVTKNPKAAARLKELLGVFNEPGHPQHLQYMSALGKEFLPLAATNYDEIAKNSPQLVQLLSQKTNELLTSYVNNPNFYKAEAFGGFIPNFASRREMFRDLIKFNLDSAPNNQNILGGKTTLFRGVRNNKNSIFGQSRNYSQTENSRDYFRNTDIDKIANDHILEKKLLPFVSASTDKDIAEYFARGRRDDNFLGSGVVGSKTIKNSRIFSEQSIRKFIDKYGEKALKDLMLELSNWGSFGHGKGMAINFESFSQKKGFEGTDFAKEISFLSNGFIPNFAKKAQAMPPRAKSAEPYRRGISWWWETKKGYISAIQKAKNSYEIEGIEVYDKYKGQGESSKFYKGIAEKIGPGNDITGVLLPQEQALADYASGKPVPAKAIFPQLSWAKMAKSSKLLVNGKEMAISDFEKGIADHKYKASKLETALIELINSHASGFIPNLANFIDVDTLGKNSIHYSGDLIKLIKDIEASIGRNLSSGELRFLTNPKTDLSKLNDPKVLNKFVNSERKGGFAQFAKGFIPNFAYKQAVMGLEESMSGQKAIFSTNPIPHIRNASQPTFSSAVADHGGLKNAMTDSLMGQKAAGLMSKGFIPNFVKYGPSYSYMPSGAPSSSSNYYPSGNPNKPQAVSPTYQAPAAATNATFQQNDIDKALQDFINSVQAADQKLGIFESTFGGRTKIIDSELIKLKNTLSKGGVSGSKLNEALDNASKKINSEQTKLGKALEKSSTTLAIAGPLIAGQLEQLFFANKKRTELSETERAVQSGLSTGLTSISTGASIGAAFGPLGAGIGAATGALVGLTSALSATKLSAEELADLNQEQAQKAQANISAASSYIEAQKSLTQMIASGASSSDIENASKKLAVNFKEIEDVKLQEIFNSTGGDVKKMTEELQKYSNEISRRSAFQKGIIEKSDVKTTVQALSIGIPKQNKKDVIEGFRKAASFSQSEMQYEQAIKQAEYSSNRKNNEGKTYKQVIDEAEKFRKENIASSLENFIPRLLDIGGITKDDPQYKSEFDNALKKFKSLPPEKLKEIADNLEKADLVSGVSQSINRLNNVATKSFNQIFLEIEQRIAKTAFDISLNFERDSGQRRIQSAILDFSINFQDSINSFLSNNLPDARKFDFTAATAGQKAQLQLQKSQQDYDKAIAEQANERSMFLNKSTKDLTETFKSSFLPSQASAQFFQQNVLSQLESGTFAGDAKSLAKQMQTKAFTEAQAPVKAAGFNLNDINNVDAVLKQITDKMEAVSTSAGATSDEYIKLESALRAIQELQKQTALYTNDNDVKKLQNAIDSYTNEKALFDLKQANAKKELEINKQLSEARIAVEKDIAVEKARVDKENLMRMEKMKDLSANIGNALEISKARSAATVNAMQRRLEDQRETYGMSRTQISERKFGIQADILKEQRAAEDAAINAEIQQRILEMAAEQENTAATLKLNDTIMTLIETQLRGAIGGQENIDDIQNRINEMGDYAQKDVDLKYGQGTFSQYKALQRIQESRTASATNNTGYNISTFESNMQSRGFNDRMTQAEQLTFLEKEETAARDAGNVVLAGTIKRYQDQIKTKQQALQITRADIDAQVRLNTEIERVNNTFAGRFRKGWGNLTSEADDLVLNLGENLPKMFGDGLVDGIKAAIRESNNLGEALMGIASKFLDSISTTLMQSAVYGILGSIGVPNLPVGGKQRGGIIRAQSGMYISGTGSGDKYPALLENGEYVLNRRAVMAMGGPSELDKLNFSMAPRFASGGSFSNQFEDLTSMEANMTTAGLEESKLYNELRDVKRQEAEQDRQKKRARKQQMAGLIGSVVAGVVTAGIGAGISNKMQNVQAGKAMNLSAKLQTGQPLTNAESLSIRPLMDKGLISPTGLYTGPSVVRTGFSGFTGYGGRQIGGSIGSRLSDTIPGYATGGLFETPIVKRYAIGGGASGSGFGAATAASNNMINNNTNANNSFSFNTTVSRDNKIEIGANTTSYAQQDIELSQNLNSRIYETVLETIRNEKRFGGSLAGVRNR